MKLAIYCQTFNCPECQGKESVKVLFVFPEIWRCDECQFWFERWELRV